MVLLDDVRLIINLLHLTVLPPLTRQGEYFILLGPCEIKDVTDTYPFPIGAGRKLFAILAVNSWIH